jgi:HPt (histidine-containing phosphotransfer) domain-containing protein
MLRGFRDSWADVATQAEQDMAAGRAAEARRAIHSVKGVAGNIGAMALYEAGAQAEAMIADGSFDPDSDTWRAFEAEHRTVVEGLAALPKAVLSAPSSVEPPARDDDDDGPSPAELAARIDRLIPLLDDDLGRARDDLGALRPSLCRICGAARVDAVQSAIENFDIDAAIAALEEMRKDIADDDE